MFDLRKKELANVLNSATSNEERVVVYHSLSMYAVRHVLHLATKSDKVVKDLTINSALLTDNVISIFGEIGVIDKMLFRGIFKNTLNYLAPVTEMASDDFYLANVNAACFEDALRITKFFSKETIDLINTKFDIYKAAARSCSSIQDEIKNIILGD